MFFWRPFYPYFIRERAAIHTVYECKPTNCPSIVNRKEHSSSRYNSNESSQAKVHCYQHLKLRRLECTQSSFHSFDKYGYTYLFLALFPLGYISITSEYC